MFITLGHMVRVCSCQTWVLHPPSYIMPVHNKGVRAVHRNVRNTQGTGWAGKVQGNTQGRDWVQVGYRVQVGQALYRTTQKVEVGGHASKQYKVSM